MEFAFKKGNNKLNLVLIVLLLLAVGLGCGKLTGSSSLENSTWKGVIVDPKSGQSFPISVDLLPDGKAYLNVTLPNTAQPMTGSAKWSKSDRKVSATWGSGEAINNFDGTVNEDQIVGTVTNSKGSIPVTLNREKKD